MKISARNQLRGTVTEVEQGVITAKVVTVSCVLALDNR
jgi:molybdopterin-binding protein